MGVISWHLVDIPFAIFIPELDGVITEVCLAIKKQMTGKSHGKDGIPAEVYKALPNQIVHLLTGILNNIFIEYLVHGLIHELGDKAGLKNYI